MSRLPADLEPSITDVCDLRYATDWAALEVKERIGDRFFDSFNQYRAVRALREGRQAFLVFDGSYAERAFGCIANDHGEDAARAWARGEGDPDIAAYYGPWGHCVDVSRLFLLRTCVVIDPQPVMVVLQHARAA
jgi:hypothetical protein